jgi:hypothetical protein
VATRGAQSLCEDGGGPRLGVGPEQVGSGDRGLVAEG